MANQVKSQASALVRDYIENLNGDLNYREIAEAVIDDVPKDELRDLAIEELINKASEYICHRRPPVAARQAAPSGRWDSVRATRDFLEDFWVSFQGGRPGKRLLDCSSADLDEVAEWYTKRAESYAARADAFVSLAERVRKAGVSIVDELPRDEVRRVINA